MGVFDDEDEGAQQVEGESTYDQVAEAEARLQEAGYYRDLMEASLFSDGDDPIAQRVQKKIRAFAKREISIIVGGGPTGEATVDQRLRSLAQLEEQEVGALKLLLTGLSEQDVAILRAMLSRVGQDPSAVRTFVGATPAASVGRKDVAKAKPRITPVPRRDQATAVRVPPRPTAPARAPEPRPLVKAEPAPEVEAPAERRAQPTKKRSPHSVSFPTGSDFEIATTIKSKGSVDANLASTNRYLAGSSEDRAGLQTENFAPTPRSQFEGEGKV